MALLGGAGNPVGGSFTGPAEALELSLNRCYAYSGNNSVTNASKTIFSFTTGNYLAVIDLQVFTEDVSGEDVELSVELNNTAVMTTAFANPYDSNFAGQSPYRFVLPAYTEVEIKLENVGGTATTVWYGLITGQVERD